jgi:hypothetical protein
MLCMLFADTLTGANLLLAISSKAVYTYSITTHAVSGITNLYIYFVVYIYALVCRLCIKHFERCLLHSVRIHDTAVVYL